MKKRNKGFTLMEMLIVVAIIAVLVAVAIPVFTNQLEKSREAVDMANLRAAYAELMTAVNMDYGSNGETPAQNPLKGVMWENGADGTRRWYIAVAATQKQTGWQGPTPEIGGKAVTETYPKGWQLEYTAAGGLNIKAYQTATGD